MKLILGNVTYYPNLGFTLYTYVAYEKFNLDKKEYTFGVFINNELRGKTSKFIVNEDKILVSVNVSMKDNEEEIQYIRLLDEIN